MALTRKMLKGMGLTDEQVDAIIEGHTESLNGVRQQQPAEPKPKEKEGSQSEEKDDWKAKYEALVHDNEVKEVRNKKAAALKALLDSEECTLSDKGKEKAIKYTSLDDIELDTAGKVKGGKKLIDSLHEEWADYVTTSETRGVSTTGNDGAGNIGNNSGKTKTREEIMDIADPIARQQAIAENHDLFGF